VKTAHDSNTFWEYNCLDCVSTAKIYEALQEELHDLGVTEFYDKLVHPVTLAVKRMSDRGMYCDMQRVQRLRNFYDAKIARYEEGLRILVGPDFNPRSLDEVADYIYNTLGCKGGKTTKTGKHKLDQLTLLTLGLKYDSAFFKMLLAHRKMSKLRSTYLTKIFVGDDGRIRSRFRVSGTATGRLSSRDPNFQNIPKERNVWFGLRLPNIRTIYTAEPGNLIFEADYSQLELRLIAYASNCKRMLDAYTAGDDIHMLTAMMIYEKQRELIVTEERDFAKRFRFCQNYGGSARRISEILFEQAGIVRSVVECENILRKLRVSEPEVFTWRDRQLEETQKTRIITNEFGRKRVTFAKGDDLAGIAYNTPIQSTAADLINNATVRLDGMGVPLINQVHDALMAEVSAKDVDEVAHLMKQEMERPVDIFGHEQLVFPVEIKVGTRWGALKKWTVKNAA
jgi:DNA polymerase-1